MPRYMVLGADRDTGASMMLTLDASDASHAERVAMAKGILVRRTEEFVAEAEGPAVEPAPPPPPPPQPRPQKQRTIRLRRRDLVMLGLAAALGIVIADATKLIVATTIAYQAAIAPPAVPVFAHNEMKVTASPNVPQLVAAMRPLEAGDGPAHPVRVVSCRADVVERLDSGLRVSYRIAVSNDLRQDYALRIAPALLGPDGDRVWFSSKGSEIIVPPGDWTLRQVMTISDAAYERSVVAGYYRW